jgi:DNA-binding transcriptional ArsR family regulator
MSDDEQLDDIVDLLADEYARLILRATSVEPLSAGELSRKYDMSPPTVYRRLERLQDMALVDVQQRIDPDGHHSKEYAAALSGIQISLEDGIYEFDVERTKQDAADRFTSLIEDL